MRQRILDTLENAQVGDDVEQKMRVMALQVIRQFKNQAQSYIDQGKMSERRLAQDGEDG